MASESCSLAALCPLLSGLICGWAVRGRGALTLCTVGQELCSLLTLFIPLLCSGHANSNLIKEEKSAYRERPTLLNHFGSFMLVLSTSLSLALLLTHCSIQWSPLV